MKVFDCDHCGQLVFFENVFCLSCGHALAYLPDLRAVGSLEPIGDGLWKTPILQAAGHAYRLCANYVQHNVCNWAIPAKDPHTLCRSCRLTRIIPDLSLEKNKASWYKLEVAKRRLVYSLLALDLPLICHEDDEKAGLAFEFLADPEDPSLPRVLTGHAEGLITVNIAEADDAERERRRLQMQEPYRTLLGHFRHESGHYYWDRLIRDTSRLEPFRNMFGDDRADYSQALQNHYRNGPPGNWQDFYISSYATAHPWEDWAETWAHYLHMTDTLEIASACGVQLRPRLPGAPVLRGVPDPVEDPHSFDTLMTSWLPLTYMLNNLNRGLGQQDAYPFVLSKAVTEKLRFVHQTVLLSRIGSGA
jgi:hypothetical protein